MIIMFDNVIRHGMPFITCIGTNVALSEPFATCRTGTKIHRCSNDLPEIQMYLFENFANLSGGRPAHHTPLSTALKIESIHAVDLELLLPNVGAKILVWEWRSQLLCKWQ